MLPPLGQESSQERSKEGAEARESTDKSDRKADKTASNEPAGCTGDKDCRNGRTCMNSRCGTPPERKRCGKDTDCPEPQECDSSGHCGGPAAQARAGEDEPQPKPAGPMLAALQSRPPTTSASDPSACLRSCDQVRNLCIETANGEASRCVTAIQADPSYRACGCPTYPAGNAECYRVCTSAYERGKSCSTVTQVQGCRTDGETCRSQCK